MKIFIILKKSTVVGIDDMIYLNWDKEHYTHSDILEIKDDDVKYLQRIYKWEYLGFRDACKIYAYYDYHDNPVIYGGKKYRLVARIIPNGFQDAQDVAEARKATRYIIKKYRNEYNYEVYPDCTTFEEFFCRYQPF